MQHSYAWSFKSDPGYREVLEHVSEAQGESFLRWSRARLPELSWSMITRLASRNDSLGKPTTNADHELRYSPSHWRYLCHAIKVWQHIDSLNLGRVDIIELGGGYGGLALWIDGLRDLFSTQLRDYTIVDLPDVAVLQSQFAEILGVPLMTANGLDAADLAWAVDHCYAVPKVLVSCYAFSEFDQETRDWYADRLVKYCAHGLMVWNFPEPVLGADGRWYGGPVYPFTDHELTVTDDEPALYAGHKLVRW